MSDTKHFNLTGGCACGVIRFEISGVMRPVIACHCETCRKTSGHHWAATQAYWEDLRMIDNKGLKWFKSSNFAQRGFCIHCGSSIFYRRNKSDRVSIAAGSLDLPTGLRLVEHICSAEAGDYYTLDNALPQHADNVISSEWELPIK